MNQLRIIVKKMLLLSAFFLTHFLVSAQLDSTIIHSMELAISDSTYPNIHSILVSRDNKVLYENYWPGRDKKRGKDLGIIAHGPDSLHGIQSITKSIVSACIGIAIDQGKIKNIHQKVFDFFPEYASLNTGLKSEITIKHLLTMTAGLKWNEENYSDTTNSEWQMNINSQPVKYVLSLPIVTTPGKTFNYCGGSTQVLAEIIKKATGMSIDMFAKEFLFTPLGIYHYEWTSCAGSDAPDAFAGLYMRSRDLLKFGLLYLNDGRYNKKQIISPGWIKASITPFIIADDGSDVRYRKSDYGFQWWLLPDTVDNKAITIGTCVGNGGQRIFVDKANKVVVVFTAGNYRRSDLFLHPYTMLNTFIYPAIFKR